MRSSFAVRYSSSTCWTVTSAGMVGDRFSCVIASQSSTKTFFNLQDRVRYKKSDS